jgi:hypothetical protein
VAGISATDYILNGSNRKSPEVIRRNYYALARAGTGAAAAAPVSLRNTVRIKANPIIASQNKWVLCKCIA